MTKRISSILLLVCMMLALLAGCNSNKALTQGEAQQIALDAMGVKESDVDSMDVHLTTQDGVACYSVYITMGSEQMEYVIHGKTGEILHSGKSNHNHSH